MRPDRLTRRLHLTARSIRFLGLRQLIQAVIVVILLASVGVASAAKPPRPPAGLAATAWVTPTVQYLGDTAGTDFTFSVRNTGTIGIGAVEIIRPSSSWTVTACPQAPAGWTSQRSDNFCRYRSDAATTDDLAPGTVTSTFQVRATTLAGTADRSGTWTIRLSLSDSFDNPSSLKPAPAEAPGLTITAFAWQITDAVVASGNAGDPCPAATAENHSAVTGSTQTILVCGRNRMTVGDTPTAARSSLAGSFIADDGTFSSGVIPANSAVMVIGTWTGAEVTSTSGAGQSIVAKVGSAVDRNSPITTLDDVCGASPAFQTCIANGGYEALNEPPDAVDDTADANEDGPAVAIDVLANDSDPDGDPFSITATGGSPDGLVAITGGGSGIDYDPNGQFEWLALGETTTDTFTYTIADTFGATDTATVTVTIHGQNDDPDAVDDTDDADEDGPAIIIDVLGNDTDPDATDVQSVASVDTTGTIGTVTNNGTDVTYDPNGQFESLAAGETVIDTFTYTVSDGQGGTDTATVTVTVHGQNDDPVANDDAGDADEDGPQITINVLANDTDADASDVLSVASVDTTGTLGSVTNNGTDVTYDPNGQFSSLAFGETALDTFTYTVSDGNGGTDTALVTVTIHGQNDGPDAVDDAADADEDGPAITIDVLANDTDDDGDTLTVGSVDTTGTLGSVTNNGTDVTYDPNGQFESLAAGETDTDTFTYTVSDGNGGTDTATVTVTITGQNDAPTATDDADDADEDGPAITIDVLANDTDPDVTDVLIVTGSDDTGTIGSVTDNGDGTFAYDPNGQFESLAAGEAVLDTFTYDISDGNGGIDTATVTVTVHGQNDLPTANDDVAETSEFDDVNIDVLANDTDPDASDVLTVQSVDTTGTQGTVTNNGTDITYDPNGQFDDLEDDEQAQDTFTYTVSDGNGGTETATVTVTILGSTDVPPTAVNDSASVGEDAGASAIDVLANDTDVDGGPKTISLASDPANGTVVLTGGSPGAHTGLTYQPDPNYCNDPPGTTPDTFTYTLNGGSTATVSVTVTCADDPPVAVNDSATLLENAAASAIDVLANDTDVDGGPKTISSASDPANGTVVLTGGSPGAHTGLTYEPDPSYCNDPPGTTPDTFTYTLNGGSTATVSVTVTCVNDAPTAADDTGAGFTTDEDTPFTTANVLANDSDPDGDLLTIVLLNITGTTGLVTYNDDGTFDYDPNGAFEGLATGESDTDTFTYTVSDGNGGEDIATVTITITGVNDPPTANDDTDTTDEDTAKTIDVLANDTDPDASDVLTVTAVDTTGTVGSVTITNAGTDINYDPNGQFDALQDGETAQDTFTYDISDGNGGTDTATVTVTVTGVNDAPEGVNDSYANAVINTQVVVGATPPSTPHVLFTGDVLDNDADVDDLESTLVATAGTFATGDGGSVTIAANGTFTYTPAVTDNDPGPADTQDTFTYTVSDTHGASDSATVTITFQAQVVWYVQAGASAGDGRSHSPFNSLTPLTAGGTSDGRDGLGDIVFVYQGTGDTTGGLVLEGSQKLHGQPHGLVVGAHALVAAGGSNPNITGGVVLANSVQVLAVNLGSAATSSLSGSGTTVTVGGSAPDTVAVNNATGKAIDVSSTTGSLTFSSVTSAGSTTEGIKLTNVGATFSAPAGSITTAAGNDVDIAGGTGNFTYNGTITNTAGRSVEITGRNSGAASTINFGGGVSDTGLGISLVDNDMSTINFNAGMTLSTGANEAFAATAGGTINTSAENVNTIVTTTGTGLRIQNTNIGSSGLAFRSINVDGDDVAPTNGIIVENTGSAGWLSISGTGFAGTGGTIRDASGDGILLVGTRSPALFWMTVTSNLGNGIHGGNGTAGGVVTDATLGNLVVSHNGNDSGSEDGILFQGLVGTATFSNLDVSGSARHNVAVINNTGTLTSLTVSGSSIHDNAATSSNGLVFIADGTATMTASVGTTNFTTNRVTGVLSQTLSAGTLTVFINGGTFTNNFVSVEFTHASSGSLTGTFNGGTITNAINGCSGSGSPCGAPVNLFLGTNSGSAAGSILRATITNNVINNGGSGNAPGIWMHTGTPVRGHIRALITGNTVTGIDERGIDVQGGGCGIGQVCDATIDTTIENNTVTLASPTALQAIGLTGATNVADTINFCVDIENNTATSAGADGIRVRHRQSSTVRLPGYAGSAFDTLAVVTYLASRNPLTVDGISAATSSAGGGFINGTCATP